MERIILHTRGGFIVGCQILDNIIIVQEEIHTSMEKNQQGTALKIDMANSFDRVNHLFLSERA